MGVPANIFIVTRLAGAEGFRLMPKELNNTSIFQKHFPNTMAIIKEPQEMPLDISYYTEYLPLTAYHIENQDAFLSSLPFDKEKLMISGGYNQVKMFYQIFSAQQLALEYERIHNFQYDYVIRIRPDAQCTSKVTLEALKTLGPNEISISYDLPGPQDQFWIGKRFPIIQLSSLYKYMFFAHRFGIFKGYTVRSHHFLLLAMAKLGLTSAPPLTKIVMNPVFGAVSLDIREALAEDFAGPGAAYKDNDNVKAFFRLIAQDSSVC
jgi:hypothetical protein